VGVQGTDTVKIVAALGNPGRQYHRTRHNAGWMALDALAERCDPEPEQFRCGGVAARSGRLLLFKPLDYVNMSGPPVARLLGAEGARIEDLLVLVDDVNLPLGSVRLRPDGSSGGHNGLQSLVDALGTESFGRLRMGIGPRPAQVDLRDFVLSPFTDDEWDAVDEMAEWAVRAVLCWEEHGIEAAMEQFNRRARE
jgi:PTH1 family peptidyl-tRNA hydrolase